MSTETSALLTVKLFCEKHRAWTEGALRNMIFLSKERHTSKGKIAGNGLDAALVRVGRKILIDEAKFFAWIESQNQKQAA
ncbi:hypothetical protein [Methylomagnum ishizawai]|uniref:hypothetical protein n=1 Tax=Methylomagnum ishizawai TaxID=1760988 RepID=UPI001C33C81B|nr:hypothetical protein [Methylomagnum ishizawai]BBL75059.1 hypothetical protein MishRS11D_21570 [Methylomagnum ishizawai]